MDAIKRLIVDWACHVRGYDALGAVANVTENGLEKHRAKGLECEAAWAAIEAAVVAETDALRAALAAARVELAEAYAFLQGFATASVGRECPPVTSTNIHRVADEVLGTMAKLRAEAAAEKQRADGLAAELDVQLTAGEALYKATVKLLAERDALKAKSERLSEAMEALQKWCATWSSDESRWCYEQRQVWRLVATEIGSLRKLEANQAADRQGGA